MKSLSGRFVIRLSPALHQVLKERSGAAGVSLNRLCESILERGVFGARGEEFGLPSGMIEKLQHVFGEALIGVVLFGSAARRELTQQSDMDLLLILKPEAPLSRAQYSVWQEKMEPFFRESLMKREVSPQFVRLPSSVDEAGSLWFEAALEGELLWEQSADVSRFLREVRRAIASGELVRSQTYGHPYWIRKKKGGAA